MLQSGSGMEFEEESHAPVYATLGVSLSASYLNLHVALFMLSLLENSWISKARLHYYSNVTRFSPFELRD